MIKKALSIHLQKIPIIRLCFCLFLYHYYTLLSSYIDVQTIHILPNAIEQWIAHHCHQSILQWPWLWIYQLVCSVAMLTLLVGYRTRLSLSLILIYAYALIQVDPSILLRVEGQAFWMMLCVLGIPWWSKSSVDIMRQWLELKSDEGDQQLNEALPHYRSTMIHSSVLICILTASHVSVDLFVLYHPQWQMYYPVIFVTLIALFCIPHWSIRLLLLIFCGTQNYASEDIRSISFFYLAFPILFPVSLFQIPLLHTVRSYWDNYYGKHLYVFYPAHIGFSHQMARFLKRIDASQKVLWLGSSLHPFIPPEISPEVLQEKKTQGLVVYQPHTQTIFYNAHGVIRLLRIIPWVGPILHLCLSITWPKLHHLYQWIYTYYALYRHKLPGRASLEMDYFEQEDHHSSISGAMRTQLVKVLSLNHHNKQRNELLEDAWYEQIWQWGSHGMNIILLITYLIHLTGIPHQLPWREAHPLALVSYRVQISSSKQHLLYFQDEVATLKKLTSQDLQKILPYASQILPYWMIMTQKKSDTLSTQWHYLCQKLRHDLPHLNIHTLIFPTFNYQKTYPPTYLKQVRQMRKRCRTI